MLKNRQLIGKYNVFTISMDADEQVAFTVMKPNNHLSKLVTLSMLLEGQGTLDVTGELYEDNKVTPFFSSTPLSSFDPFDRHRTQANWLDNTKVLLTAKTPAVYLCVSIASRVDAPVTYEIKDINLTEIPVSALFILTVDCGEYLKNKPYVNEITGLTLEAQEGKIIIVQEAE